MDDKPDWKGWNGLTRAWIALVIYVLSVGPAGWVVNATGQRWIFWLYAPLWLAASIAGPVEHGLDWYINLWLQS